MVEHGRPSASQVIASFTTYDGAQEALRFLGDRRFPVEEVSIVAGDVRFVEQITGRRGYLDASVDGAASGAVTGALLGFFLGVFSLVAPLSSALALALWGLAIGTVVGAVVGIVSTVLAGRRGFRSMRYLEAGRYDLLAPASVADRGRTMLADRRARPAA